jgi:hypothetical protein
MTQLLKSSVPPKGAVIAIKLARVGKFQDEWEDYFQQQYEDQVRRRGEKSARRWAYRHAAKTVFHATVEMGKLALMIYLKFAGR